MPRTTNSLVKQRNYVGDSISATNNTQRIENKIVQENAETNAQAAARAEYDLNVNIEQGSNFYFLTYNGIYDDLIPSIANSLSILKKSVYLRYSYLRNERHNTFFLSI